VARISTSRNFDASPDRVWTRLADLSTHHTWMKDAESIRFLGPRQTGVGTRMEVPTRVGPLRTKDIVEVIGWNEGKSISVNHRGLVKGVGEFVVAANGQGTTVSWSEDLQFPWWLGGRITAWLSRPILRRIWAGNLQRLHESLSAPD
jgi:carbon monoxide dehydrogenase subunit G